MKEPFHTISRRGLLGLGALAAGAALAGCSSGGGSGGTTTLRFMFWGSDDRVQRFTKACELFTKKNPDITIEPEYGDIDSIRTKSTVAMASKQLPDVIWVVGDLFPQMVEDGHLVDLTEYLGHGIDVSGFTDPLLASGILDGKQYALPHGLQSVGVFAKEPVLEEIGIPELIYPDSFTWEQYAEYSRQAHEVKGDSFYGTDDPNYAGAPNHFRAYARQHDQDLWSDDGDVGFTEALLTDWLDYWEGLRADGGAVPTALALEQNPYFEGAPMIRGLAAFHMRNSNQIAELQALSSEPLVLLPVPGNGGDGASNIALDPNTLGIASNTKNPEAAVKFVDFLLNDADRATIIGTTIGAPPTEEMREAAAEDASDAEKLFLDYMGFETSADSKPIPAAPPTGSAFQTDMGKAIESMAYGQQSVEETVSAIFGDLRSKHLGK